MTNKTFKNRFKKLFNEGMTKSLPNDAKMRYFKVDDQYGFSNGTMIFVLNGDQDLEPMPINRPKLAELAKEAKNTDLTKVDVDMRQLKKDLRDNKERHAKDVTKYATRVQVKAGMFSTSDLVKSVPPEYIAVNPLFLNDMLNLFEAKAIYVNNKEPRDWLMVKNGDDEYGVLALCKMVDKDVD